MFFFKQKTAYEMRISDWSSDVCSSDLVVIQDLVVALSLAAVPVHRVIETRGRSVLEMHRLAGKRAETRGDEQEPGEQFRPVFRRAQKPSGLLGEIDEDRGGVEDPRLPSAGAFGVADGGTLAFRVECSS